MTPEQIAASLELADRCEKAAGPDRELDAQIGRFFAADFLGYVPDEPQHGCAAFTASLDAAMTLVPADPGKFAITAASRDGRWQAWVWTFDDAPNWHEAATPALALCAAALRSRTNGDDV